MTAGNPEESPARRLQGAAHETQDQLHRPLRIVAAAVAVTSSLLNSVASGTVEVVVLTVAILTGAGSFHIPSGGAGNIASKVFLVAVVLAVLTAIAFGIPSLRHRVGGLVMPQIRSAWTNLRGVLRDPRKGSLMLGGNLLSQVFYALVLWAALHMYGHDLGLMKLLIINTLASVLGGIAPVPGGIGVIEAGHSSSSLSLGPSLGLSSRSVSSGSDSASNSR